MVDYRALKDRRNSVSSNVPSTKKAPSTTPPSAHQLRARTETKPGKDTSGEGKDTSREEDTPKDSGNKNHKAADEKREAIESYKAQANQRMFAIVFGTYGG